MVLWLVSFFTGIIVIVSLYFALQLANPKLRYTAVIALLLLLVGETFDILAELVLNDLLLFFSETLELFVGLGFLVMTYYIYERKKEVIKRRKRKK